MHITLYSRGTLIESQAGGNLSEKQKFCSFSDIPRGHAQLCERTVVAVSIGYGCRGYCLTNRRQGRFYSIESYSGRQFTNVHSSPSDSQTNLLGRLPPGLLRYKGTAHLF